MKPEILINDASVTHEEYSLDYQSNLSERASTAKFTIIDDSVEVQDEVKINRKFEDFLSAYIAPFPAIGGKSKYLDNFFGGYIAVVDRRLLDGADGVVTLYDCQAQDYNARLNSILIDETYSGNTEAEIIADLFTTYWPEIDASTYVDGESVVTDIAFPNIYLSEALDMLAGMYDKKYTINYDKALHYFSNTISTAPFSLSSTIDLILSTPQPCRVETWRDDGARIINRVTVKGTGVEEERVDNDSFTQYGVYFDYLHSDPNIDTASWAQLVGDGILEESAYSRESGQIVLWHEGLVVGQVVTIYAERWGINGDYLIRSLNLKMTTPDKEEIVITVGNYDRDLIGLLKAINTVEKR